MGSRWWSPVLGALAASLSPSIARAQEVGPGEVAANPVFVPGSGLTFESDDGRFGLAMRLRAQFLYSVVVDAEAEETLHAYQIRRARLQFGGNVFGEHNRFKAELAFSPRDESVGDDGPGLTPMLDWYAEFDHLRDLSLRVGQYKVPFNRQRVISSGDLQMVDRSPVQGEFTLDRDVGLHVFSKDLGGLDLFRYYAGAWINQGRDAHESGPLHPMLIGRVEVLPLGMFEDYEEADLERLERPGLSIGAAYAFVDDATNDRGILGDPFPDAGTADLHVVTGDMMFKVAGFSLLSEVYLRRGERNPGGAVDEAGEPVPVDPAAQGTGWFVQSGYVLPPMPLEVTARYDQIRPMGQTTLAVEHALGGGVSYYFAGHPFKLQADYFRLWGQEGPGAGADQVRLQLQLGL